MRLVGEYVQHYADAADMWQVDNEFGCHGTKFSFTEMIERHSSNG